MAERYHLKIADGAESDLDDLYTYGFNSWGEARADGYYNGLLERFDQLCDNPYLYTAVDDIREGYRRSVYGAHSIYYRIQGDTIEIMALIGQQDIEKLLN